MNWKPRRYDDDEVEVLARCLWPDRVNSADWSLCLTSARRAIARLTEAGWFLDKDDGRCEVDGCKATSAHAVVDPEGSISRLVCKRHYAAIAMEMGQCP